MKNMLFFIFIVFSPFSFSQVKVVTSTQTVASLVEAVGQDLVQVEFLARGTEDPHYIEAKPSFMVKVRNAQLVVLVGLELEKAWMDSVLKGARNPKLQAGQEGVLELGTFIDPMEQTTADRSQGDVHPMGNPHFYLDPVRIKKVLPHITNHLVKLMPEKESQLKSQLDAYSAKLEEKIKLWDARATQLKTKKVITYHRTLVYFLDRFRLTLSDTIEPKPGIPPTPSHSLSLIKKMKDENILCILNESHFETVAAQKIAKEQKAQVSVVPTEVGAATNVKTYFDLIEKLVLGLESCH